MQKLLFIMAAGALLAVHGSAQTVVTVPVSGAQVRLTLTKGEDTLVSDKRKVTLPAGRVRVRFPDVTAHLNPPYVQPVFGGGVEVLEQRMRSAELATTKKMMDTAIGKSVTLMRYDGSKISGTLSRVDGNWALELPEGLAINPEGTFIIPKPDNKEMKNDADIPAGLEWLVNAMAGERTVEVRYPVSGLQWQPIYRATLNAAGDRLSLRGWIEVSNQSGGAFYDAQLILQEGKTPPINFPRPVSLSPNEAIQLSYVALDNIAVTPEIVFSNPIERFSNAQTVLAPQITLRLANRAENGLGVPLPSGPLTILQQAADESLRWFGQQNLSFTLPQENIVVSLGEAQGLMVTRVQPAMRQLNPKVTEYTLTDSISNRRSEAVTVIVQEALPAGARVTESSQPVTIIEGNTAELRVAVPAKSSIDLRIVLEVKK